MAVITPQTDLVLLKVPLEIDENNQLTFTTATAQHNYFDSLPKLEVFDFTYQRADDTVRFGASYDDVISYNYCMYRNNEFSDKWFYAFITDVRWKSPNSTDITIKTDPWQTWQFDLHYKPVFVEREHVNDDTVGLHTLPENLELGEYVKNSNTGTLQFGASDMLYAVGVSEVIGTLSPMPSSIINGLPNGLYYVFVDSSTDLHWIADMYDKAGKPEAIYTMFIFPKQLLHVVQGDTGTYKYDTASWDYTAPGGSSFSMEVYVPTDNSLVGTISSGLTVPLPTTVGKTYYPINNKLKTFPYVFFNVANNSGTTVTYHYEDFNGTPTFNIEGIINIGCSIKMYPTNYKNMTIFSGDIQDNPYEYGINAGKYPTISWNSDSFTNWITQNAVNIGMNMANTGLSTLASLGMGNLVGAGSSLLNGITNSVAQIYQASLIPDQARGNQNVGDLDYSKHKNKFTVFEMSIKPEYAKICDSYFSMFGYKVNEVKRPNIIGRRNWNYVKTIGCYIEADIPQTDLSEIKTMFDRGVTFWHNPATFADYSQNNDII